MEEIFSGSVLTVVAILAAVAFCLLVRIALTELLPQLRPEQPEPRKD